MSLGISLSEEREREKGKRKKAVRDAASRERTGIGSALEFACVRACVRSNLLSILVIDG